MAWLAAAPKPPDGSKRAAADAPRLSRIDELKRQKITPQMPPNRAPHITGRLVDMGLVEVAGLGAVPIGWQTLAAWQSMVGVSLQPWEARLLRRLSSDYLAESKRAENENCPAPWQAEVSRQERSAEEAQLRAILG